MTYYLKGLQFIKLMNKLTLRDDDGIKTTHDWGSWYNYSQDTVLPYTNSVQMSADKTQMIGANDTTTFNIKVIDQFGNSLSGVTVNLVKDSGDDGYSFDPENGQVETDINGASNCRLYFWNFL